MCKGKQGATARSDYATCADFCETFATHLEPLYRLAFLLTGNHAEAELCFVATVEDAARATCIFKGWERSWSKRCLVINAIRRKFPHAFDNGGKPGRSYEVNIESQGLTDFDIVSRLASPLPRFVFVMSVLERYSVHDCALLLGCTIRDVVEARIQAFAQLSGLDPTFTRATAELAVVGKANGESLPNSERTNRAGGS
jgi:DNA-directed RNA polymerase specialized sigma24 family protein